MAPMMAQVSISAENAVELENAKELPMKVQQAAGTALILVVIHLVLRVMSSAYNLVRIIPNASRIPQVVFQTVLSMALFVVLDVALILVLAAMSRTTEQQMLDSNS